MIKICIVDDHPVVRSGLKQLINQEKDIDVVFETSNAEDMFSILNEANEIDLVVLDIALPGMDGMEALQKLRHGFPQTPVLIISGLSEKRYAVQSIRKGASGYLNKVTSADEFVKAIRDISGGKKYYKPAHSLG
jgi:DNA-binding NarL/FixJ family response regulator